MFLLCTNNAPSLSLTYILSNNSLVIIVSSSLWSGRWWNNHPRHWICLNQCWIW